MMMMMMMGHQRYYYLSKYAFDVKLGQGAFGCVYKAFNKYSAEVVAIKILKDNGDVINNLNEVKVLGEMQDHPNVQLKEVLMAENKAVGLVFEYMDCSLYKLMKDVKRSRRVCSEVWVRNCCFQILKGLDHMHKRGYFHRDLKPDNLLVTRGGIVKIADLGSATKFKPDAPNTKNIGTLRYRAPEMLLESSYGPAIDMWAMGAIMTELFLLKPLFPGTTAIDQLYKICRMIGSPGDLSWLGADADLYKFPQLEGMPFFMLTCHVSKEAFDLMAQLLSWNPSKRPTAAEALCHPFFKPCYEVEATSQCSTFAPPVAFGSARTHQLVL